MSKLNKRFISAIVMISIFLYLIYDASILGVIFAELIFSIVFWEYLGFFKKKKNKIIFTIVFIFLNVIFPLLIINFITRPSTDSIFPIFIFSIASFIWILIGITIFRFEKEHWSDLKVACLGILVLTPAMDSLFIILSQPMYPLLIIGTVSIADTAAYFFGKKFGKTLIIPKVSPGKTVEGFVSSLIVTPFVTMISAIIFNLNIFHFIFFGIAIALISFFGDVFFSLLKRNKGMKDSSDLIPGHGGFIDLLDGTIAVLPFFALSALMVFLLGFNFSWITF